LDEAAARQSARPPRDCRRSSLDGYLGLTGPNYTLKVVEITNIPSGKGCTRVAFNTAMFKLSK